MMMLDKIRTEIEQNKGKLISFRFNGARNQIEVFDGMIVNTYKYVFLVKVNNASQSIRSYTYTDILIDNLEIIHENS